MTAIDTHVSAGAAPADADRGWAGIAAWLTTTDHKRIGRMYVAVSLLALVGVSTVGLLLGLERADTTSDLVDAGAVAQLFSAYRVGLVFCVVVPLLLGLAIAVVPLQVGSRSLAFPRLAASGFWAWLFGAGLTVGTIAANGGPGGGDSRMVAMFLGAHLVLILGLLAGAASVAVTVLTSRAPGMNMRRVPLFAWSALVSALGLLVVLPVLAGTLVYVYLDYRYGRAGLGGNKAIIGWIGFAFSQPATFVYALPALGVAAEAVAVATRRRLPARGIAFAGLGLVAVGAFGAATQHVSGLRIDILDASFGTALKDILPYALFNVLPVLGALVVLAVVAFALRAGRPTLIAPLLFGLTGALLVFAGTLANALFLVGDARLAGTVFEEGAWLSVMYGAVLAALGALVYWGPKLWGRTLPGTPLVGLALLGFLGAALASLPLYVAGFADQPGDAVVFDYSGPQSLWNVLSTIGHGLVLVTVLGVVGLALRGFTGGEHAGDDPWDGQTLEWATSSPAPFANFSEVHTVASPEPLLDLKPQPASTTGSNA
jgi:heme/copper-type cytochrome/quinol oxidase subunit 1